MTAYELKKIAILSVGGVDFRFILSGISKDEAINRLNNSVLEDGKWYTKSWKEFDQLKNIDQKYYCSDNYDPSAIKYGVKCGTS